MEGTIRESKMYRTFILASKDFTKGEEICQFMSVTIT